MSVDPAPPAENCDVQRLKEDLMNEDLPLFLRYRAMFSLRNLNTDPAVDALGPGELLTPKAPIYFSINHGDQRVFPI